MRHVFTYGSLMFGEVWRPLAQREFASMAATLEGYQREGVAGQLYPGIRPCPGAVTPGRVYLDVDDATLERLDAFEGDEYRRATVSVRVSTPEGRATWVDAEVYVLADRSRLDGKPWNAERFGRDAAASFYQTHAPE